MRLTVTLTGDEAIDELESALAPLATAAMRALPDAQRQLRVRSAIEALRRAEPTQLQSGSFGVHRFLLQRATGAGLLPGRPFVEFQSGHFHQVASLRASEVATVREARPLESLRVEARTQGDAPHFREGVDAYVERCIGQCRELLGVFGQAASQGLGAFVVLDNCDWDYD